MIGATPARRSGRGFRQARSRCRISPGRSPASTLGTAVGVLPGIGPALTVAVLLPVTFSLDPISAFIMFGGIYYGAMYGGSTTSILINSPGETASIVTAIDGHMMARQGRGAAALTTAAIGSFVAGHARHDRADVLRAAAGVGRAALRARRSTSP